MLKGRRHNEIGEYLYRDLKITIGKKKHTSLRAVKYDVITTNQKANGTDLANES